MISVIVPVYNVEKYLKKCIDSILGQTYQEFEIILVDDGSTDSSVLICDGYANNNSKIRVIHKINGGLSDARNMGIELSQGEYITFIDSDDFIKKDYLENLMKIVSETNADIVISGFINYYENHGVPITSEEKINYEYVAKEECYSRMLLQQGIDVSSTAKLYQKKIFENIRFVKGQLYEDINIIDQIIEASSNIVITTYKGYYYLQRQGSIMYCDFAVENLALLEATDRLINLMKRKYVCNLDAARYRDIYCTFHLIGRSILDKQYNSVSEMLRSKIMDNKKFIYVSGMFHKKEIIATMLLNLGLGPYRICWKLYKIFLKM